MFKEKNFHVLFLCQILPKEQHGDGDVMLRWGCPGPPSGGPDLFVTAQHCGGGHSALHASLWAFLCHRAHRIHWWPLQAALKDRLCQPQALRGVNQPRDLLGGHRGNARAQPAQTHEDHQTLHQDRPALSRVQELQLHVCHHQVRQEISTVKERFAFIPTLVIFFHLLYFHLNFNPSSQVNSLTALTVNTWHWLPLLNFSVGICGSPHSGLNLAPVSRLRGTWEKLPSKYEKLFGDLQDLFDPSRNMAKYRNVLNNQNLQPPVIPLFPVIKKDLTFLHEGR